MASLAKWLSVRLQIKWLCVRIKVAVTQNSDIPVSSKEFPDIQVTIEGRFTLKRMSGMIITEVINSCLYLRFSNPLIYFVLFLVVKTAFKRS